MFSNMDDGKHEVFSLEYVGAYETGSMLFQNVNSANYWLNEFLRSGATCTLRKLCKKHAKMQSSYKYGKCCKVVYP